MKGFPLVLKVCGDHFGFSPMAMISLRRDKDVRRAMSVAMYVARTRLGMCFGGIAEASGVGSVWMSKKMVSASVASVEAEMKQDPEFRVAVEQIEDLVDGGLECAVEELVSDLPAIQRQYEVGATMESIADWYGIDKKEALLMAEFALSRGLIKPVYAREARIYKILPLST